MHQFKGTVLPALRAGSSSLATNMSVQNVNLHLFQKCAYSQASWLSGSTGRILPFPLLPGKARWQICCTWVPGRWGLSPSDLLQTLKSSTLASHSLGGGSSADSRRAPGHSMSGPREGREDPGPPTLCIPGPGSCGPCKSFC